MLESLGTGHLINFYFKCLLKHAANTPPKTDSITGDKILSHNWIFRIVPISCLAVAIMMGYISTVASPWDDTVESILFSVTITAFLLFGVIYLTQSFISRVYVYHEGITVKTPAYRHDIRWENISSITFSFSHQAFIITANNREESRVCIAFNGIKYLINCFEKYLSLEVDVKVISVINEINARVKTGTKKKKP